MKQGVFVLGALGLLACSSSSEAEDSRVFSEKIAHGDALFHDRERGGLRGNGRACSDCHVDEDGFQLSPERTEARYQEMLGSGVDDPLFRPIDADDFADRGADAREYTRLRENGLTRIRFLLPTNFKLVDPESCVTAGVAAPCDTAADYALSDSAFTDVWRAVPSVLNVRLSGPDRDASTWQRDPNPTGGYQLDGRIDTLQNQARSAFFDHAEVTAEPDVDTLDALAAYQESLRAPEEPQLDALESSGKLVFTRACSQCHGGESLSKPLFNDAQRIVRYFDDQATCPPPVDTEKPARWSFAPCSPSLERNVQTYEVTFADGFKRRLSSSDPGRALLSGYVVSGPPEEDGSCAHEPCGQEFQDDWQKLDIAALHGIGKTAPYFHNNSAATLEAVVIHYEEVFKRIAALFPPPAQLPPLLTTDGEHVDRPNGPEERQALVAYLERL